MARSSSDVEKNLGLICREPERPSPACFFRESARRPGPEGQSCPGLWHMEAELGTARPDRPECNDGVLKRTQTPRSVWCMWGTLWTCRLSPRKNSQKQDHLRGGADSRTTRPRDQILQGTSPFRGAKVSPARGLCSGRPVGRSSLTRSMWSSRRSPPSAARS